MSEQGQEQAPEEASDEAAEWLSVSQAAARLGVSERTVQRRCKSGSLQGELKSTEDGAAWFISGATLPPSLPTGADKVPPTVHAQDGEDGGTLPPSLHEVPPTAAIAADTADVGADTSLTAHLLEENRFLRAQVEAHARAEAELRAALREALKLGAKALPSGDATAPDAATAPLSGTNEQPGTLAPSGPQIARPRGARAFWQRWFMQP